MSQPLILVADDEPKIRRLLSINLASLGYEVICAVDGPSALQVFEDHQPDLVLLDIMMPGLDGFDPHPSKKQLCCHFAHGQRPDRR